MGRTTTRAPERGSARQRLLDAALEVVRERGFTATSVDELCRRAEVTKGAFFHHFASKEALGIAAAEHWGASTSGFFATAPYHDHEDPLERVLAYVAFRRSMIAGSIPEFSCFAGTTVQETHHEWPAVRDAAGATIFAHAATLEADLAAAMEEHGITGGMSAASLARHTQAVIQGGLVLAKAADDPQLACEAIDHLDNYLRHFFGVRVGNTGARTNGGST